MDTRRSACSVVITILANLDWCGIRLDTRRNTETTGVDGCISADDAPVAVFWAIPVDEAAMLVEQAVALGDLSTPA